MTGHSDHREPISVCLATCNGGDYIAAQLKSILDQLAAQDEVVICDDQSVDTTYAIVASFADTRVRWYANPHRLGVTANFERALNLAAHPLIFLADQDDIWLPGRVEKLAAALQQADLVVSDCAVVNADLQVLAPSFFAARRSGPGLLRNLARNSYLGCCMALRRELLARALPFPAKVPMHDWWLGLVAERWGSSLFLPQPLLLYRRHGRNASPTAERSDAGIRQRLAWRWTLIAALFARGFRRSRRA